MPIVTFQLDAIPDCGIADPLQARHETLAEAEDRPVAGHGAGHGAGAAWAGREKRARPSEGGTAAGGAARPSSEFRGYSGIT